MAEYEAGYNFAPGDNIWVANRKEKIVIRGSFVEASIKIYKESNILKHKIAYLTQFENEQGDIWIDSSDAFTSPKLAMASLFAKFITPTPTPTVTPTPSGI